MPAVRGDARDVNEAVYGELTYHAAYDPQRAIRTRRHKYVRRWGDRDLPVLPNIDDSPSKDLLLHHGLAEMPRPREELYDLLFDPNEAHNLAESPDHADLLAVMRDRLETWMQTTDDPLLAGHVAAPPAPRSTTPRASRRPRRRARTPARSASPRRRRTRSADRAARSTSA